jgi:hypothetical protein
MIESLTEQQVAKFPEYVEKFTKLGLSTLQLTPTLEADITRVMADVYKVANLAAPKCIFLPSPQACLVAVSYFQEQLDKGVSFDTLISGFSVPEGYKPTAFAKEQVNNFAYGSLDASWLSFYSFFLNETEVQNLEQVKPLIELLGKCSFYLPYEDVVFVSANPTEILMVNGSLHSTTGPAWTYSDGFCGYSLDGVAVDK